MKVSNAYIRLSVAAIILSLLLVFSSAGLCAEYFVSERGDNGNPGTEAKPWLTLAHAAKVAVANDTVQIQNGNYVVEDQVSFENPGPITFKAFPGHTPTFTYTGNKTSFISVGQNKNYITLDGLTFVRASNSDGNVLTVGGQSTTIRNCTIYFSRNYSPEKYDCIKINATGNDTIIEKCHIYGAPQQGIDSVGASDLLISNNIIHDCGNAIVLKGGSQRDIIEHNVCYNLKYGAIGLGGTTASEWINYTYENKDSIVRFNVIYYDNANNIGGGIFLWGAKNSIIHNNTLFGPGIHLKNGGDATDPKFNCENIHIYNNIIWRTGNDGILVIDKNNDAGIQLNNNLYWKTTGSGEFKINGTWYSYSQFKTLFNFDNASLWGDPSFADITLRDFRLTQVSPCIDKGLSIQGEIYKGEKIDIGAKEYSLTPARPSHLRVREQQP